MRQAHLAIAVLQEIAVGSVEDPRRSLTERGGVSLGRAAGLDAEEPHIIVEEG